MITDLDLIDACIGTYVGAPQSWGNDKIHAFVSQVNGTQIIAFEGTQSIPEWVGNVLGATPDDTAMQHDAIGLVHREWYEGVVRVAPDILSYLEGLKDYSLAFTGHSRGAAHAEIMAAVLTLHGIRIERLSTFGTPRCGRLNGITKDIPGYLYQNMRDPVFDVPIYLHHPDGRLQYHVHEPGAEDDPWRFLRDHRPQLYRAGVIKAGN